jgi:hypothetical protein
VETEVVEIDQEGFLQLIHDQPHVGLDLMRQLAHVCTHDRRADLNGAGRAWPNVNLSPIVRAVACVSLPPAHFLVKTAEVLRLVAEQAPLANSPALVTSLIRPGRAQEALVYVLETDEPSDLLELIIPFMGLVQWDIAPALELDVALAATVQAEGERGQGSAGARGR